LADGRQPTERPVVRTALLQLDHEETVRQHDQVHVPCLALAIAKLTVSHAKLLLAVPMIGLRPCPAAPIAADDPRYFPSRPIGHEHFACIFVSTVVPDDDDAHFMIDAWNPNRAGKVPLPSIAAAKLLAALSSNRSGELLGLQFFPSEPDLAIKLQVTYVRSRLTESVLLAVHVIEVLSIGKIAVKRENAGDISGTHFIDELSKQDAVIFERFTGCLALFAFLEPTKMQGKMLPVAADVIGKQIVVGNLMAILRMIPEPTDILDEFSVVVDQHVINGDNALIMIPSAGLLLQEFKTLLVQRLNIPIACCQESVEARLVSRFDKLGIDAAHRLVLRDHQACNVFSEMTPLRLARKYLGEFIARILHNSRKVDDRGHGCTSLRFQEPWPNRTRNAKKIHPSPTPPHHLGVIAPLAIPHLAVAS
jgi:hypothetical protein